MVSAHVKNSPEKKISFCVLNTGIIFKLIDFLNFELLKK